MILRVPSSLILAGSCLGGAVGLPLFGQVEEAEPSGPLRALLVCGGCCHDYDTQHRLLQEGIQARANVVVDVVHSRDRSTRARFPMYEDPEWAKGYDVVIHDECSSDVKDAEYVQNIVRAHRTVPAVNLHCAMHSYRTGTGIWFDFLGLESTGHGPQLPIEIEFTDEEHPITEGLADWTTGNEELYNNVEIHDVFPLATGRQVHPDGKVDRYVVAWTNETQGARSFSTTLGHNNATVGGGRYLDLVVRGLLWACDKLDAGHLVAYEGEPGKVTTLEAAPAPSSGAEAAPPAPPEDATLVTPTASSEEASRQNFAWRAFDGDAETRWCASGASMPQWLQFEFDAPRRLSGVAIVWESRNNAYRHRIEGSSDGKAWTLLAEAGGDAAPGDSAAKFPEQEVRYVRITCTGTSAGGWASIREVRITAEGVQSIAPKPTDAIRRATVEDRYKSGGNIEPVIVRLSGAEEEAVLADAKVADGFELSLFADSRAANYPVFVAAAPNGDLYVSSDGNGSLGRNPGRGRVLRLRDTDGDGRADEVTKFVDEIDSPRGLVWDHDRLYLVHPPDVSVFIDADADGVAEERRTLVRGIAFGFADRPADHTTNGLSLGIDGWLYAAGGDFGFMEAVGTDGRRLQHRGGGVIRFRPDGSGLEIHSTGTRNIVEATVSPTMDLFARDNTNDGGGWDVRFHHFAGMDDHGYPRLYMNFADEAAVPVADYGGGSGCGAVHVDEPGFPAAWNRAPFTCDWGTGALWRHALEPKGASFVETAAPEPFVRLTRPTDGDVDAMGNLYLASWKGATFDWAGPEAGYIVRIKPAGHRADPLPGFAALEDAELVACLESASHRRRLEAQRTLVRRGLGPSAVSLLADLVGDRSRGLESRVAAVYALALGGAAAPELPAPDDPLLPHAIRAFENACPHSATQSDDPRVRLAAIQALTRTGRLAENPHLAEVLADPDPVVTHVAIRAMASVGAVDPCLAILDDPGSGEAARRGAARVLGMIHTPPCVDALIARLESSAHPDRRPLLAALCRLHFREGEWNGDSWGTRPDTRGPYYQPEPWSESERIAAELSRLAESAEPTELAFLAEEMRRNRIENRAALARVVALAERDAAFVSDAVRQLAAAETIPPDALPVLIAAAQDRESSSETLADAVSALVRLDGDPAWAGAMDALATLRGRSDADRERRRARDAFLTAPKLENHHQTFERMAEGRDSPSAIWADAALIALAERDKGSPEARERAAAALDSGWADARRREQIIAAAAIARSKTYGPRILAAVDDPNPGVASAAKDAVAALRLKPEPVAEGDHGPPLGTLNPEEVVARIGDMKGDVELGAEIFSRQTCAACHTVAADETPKGPYLGNIAQTYPRAELAWNILDPNRTIAQGFVSEVFTDTSGNATMGFVTLESAQEVRFRDIAANEHTLAIKDIAKRDRLPISLMPAGLVNALTLREFASLLDYLESLAKK